MRGMRFEVIAFTHSDDDDRIRILSDDRRLVAPDGGAGVDLSVSANLYSSAYNGGSFNRLREGFIIEGLGAPRPAIVVDRRLSARLPLLVARYGTGRR
ncbi:MAG TPA: hypothetical protein VNU75_13455 [Acidimicrobiales bacterium]|jgi:hypothetical protein|nr:hypothetical protein [Acidimicrobiales bacterium]